jgi:DNA-binding helix-hairpin-helix protein with protein kinase domain
MEAQGANPLFPFVVPGMHGGGIALDAEALWHEIQGLGALGPPPPIPTPPASPSAAALGVGPPNAAAKPIAWMIALGIFIGGLYLMPALFWVFGAAAFAAYHLVVKQSSKTEEVERFKKALSDAEAAFNRVNTDWQHRGGDREFSDATRNFDAIRKELHGIPAKRIRALDQLKHDQRSLQLDRFLDNFDIEDAKIKSIGPGRKRTLESYGIETAKDLVPHRIKAVPGFGPKMAARLMSWRRSIEGKFVFDSAKAIDSRDIAKVEQDIVTLRNKTAAAAKAAHAEAMQAHARVIAARNTMRSQMDTLQAAVAQARADWEFVKRS